MQQRIYGDGWPDEDFTRLMLHYIRRLLDETKELEFEISTRRVNYDKVKEETVDVVLMGLAISTAVFKNYHEFTKEVDSKLQHNKVRTDRAWREHNQ